LKPLRAGAVAIGLALGGVLIGYAAASASRAWALERLPIRAAGDGVAPAPPVLADGPVRNVVLLVGDGMGLTQIAAGRILTRGAEGRLHLEAFPTIGLVTTQAAGALITKSDAAATALATGVKTENGRLGTDPSGRPLPTLLEALRDAGWAVGLVTTTRITDATPAAFAAHVAVRTDEAEIAAQLSAAKVDLLVGGGLGFFLPHQRTRGGRSDGRDLGAEMRARGAEVVTDTAGLAAATRLPLAALFAVEPQKAEPRSPTLAAMANRALALLSGSGRSFFLLLEEEEIDTAAHLHDGARMSAALARFDAAVAVAVDFAARDGATLVLVLADHATGGLSIDGRSGTTEMALHWGSWRHTGEPVPVFAYGPPSAAGRFAGMHDNTEIPHLVAAALGVEFPRPAPSPAAPGVTK